MIAAAQLEKGPTPELELVKQVLEGATSRGTLAATAMVPLLFARGIILSCIRETA